MAKKSSHINSPSIPTPNSLPNRDVVQRLNFLLQAAHYLAVATTDHHHPQINRSDSSAQQPPIHHHNTKPLPDHDPIQSINTNTPPSNHQTPNMAPTSDRPPKLPMIGLSRLLSKTIKVVAKKAVVRMDPSVKRSICRSCDLLLLPGQTCSVRVLASGPHLHKVCTTCLACQQTRIIPHPPELQSMSDKDSVELPSIQFGKRRMRRERRQRRRIPFWKQDQHITYAGLKLIPGKGSD